MAFLGQFSEDFLTIKVISLSSKIFKLIFDMIFL